MEQGKTTPGGMEVASDTFMTLQTHIETDDILASLLKLVLTGLGLSLVIAAVLSLGAQICYVLNIDLDESLVEWLQFATLLGGSVLLAVRRERKGRWLRLLVAAGFFVLAMEEIDWAQPYLGYAPLHLLADNNPYHEMALHNAFGLEHVLRKVMVLGSVVGCSALLASVMYSLGLGRLCDYARRTLLGPGAVFSAGIMVLIVGRIVHPDHVFGFDEFAELAIYAGMVWFALSRPLQGLHLPRWRSATAAREPVRGKTRAGHAP